MRLIVFLLGLVIGGYAVHVYDQREYGLGGYATEGGPRRDDFDERMKEWHLTPEDIRNDLAKTGEVVRDNAREVGGKLDDARIIAVIKAKYVADKDLSALDIHVSSTSGYVTLTGTVANDAFVGKAVVLALDTAGVRNVTAKLAARQ